MDHDMKIIPVVNKIDMPAADPNRVKEEIENTLAIPREEILDTAFGLSALAWPLGYQWPVHRLSPNYLPDETPDTPTFFLVLRPMSSIQVSVLILVPVGFD